MKCYGIPSKIMRMVQVMCTNSTSAVVDGGGRTDWFEVKSGVKQGCNMSGFLFLLVIDWDLDFADDLALISSTFAQIQKKIDHLNRNGKGTG
ncbi:hypothetical protein ACROYT_G030709 [Oculina patagonica]